KPSPWECDRKSGPSWPASRAALSRYRATKKKTLRAKKPAIADLRQPACAQSLRELAAHLLARFRMIDRHVTLASARIVVAAKRGDALEYGRLPGAVLSNDDRDRGVEGELEIIREDRQAKRISRAIMNLRRLEPDPLQIRRRQVDRPIAFPRHCSPL